MADEQQEDPSVKSGDVEAMSPYWHMVNDILCGATAMRGIVGGSVYGPAAPFANLAQLNRGNGGSESPYLPRYPKEPWDVYDLRRKHAPFTNIYADISKNLAVKPFTKKCELDEKSPEDLKNLATNIDGMGNDLHVVAQQIFKGGIDKGVHYILVDFTRVPAGITLADERGMGARPYWVSLPAERIIAGYSAFVAGEEIITHVRIDECAVERVGYNERKVERIREFDRPALVDELGNFLGSYGPPVWRLWQLQEDKDAKTSVWEVIDEGPVSIGVIPLIRFYTSKPEGWKVEPILKDIAYLQVEEFQQESAVKNTKEYTAYPMLAGQGVSNKDASGEPIEVPVGPRAVLFAPPGVDGTVIGHWEWIKTDAACLTFLDTSLAGLREEMRNLGMQPLAVANQTVVNTANISTKAHSQIQAIALLLKDALEGGFRLVSMWLGRKDEEITVDVHTDFGVDITADKELPILVQCEAASIISKKTMQDELKRRGVLSDDFDPDDEEQRLAEQQQGLEPEQVIDPVTGKVVPNMAKLTVAPKLPPK